MYSLFRWTYIPGLLLNKTFCSWDFIFYSNLLKIAFEKKVHVYMDPSGHLVFYEILSSCNFGSNFKDVFSKLSR